MKTFTREQMITLAKKIKDSEECPQKYWEYNKAGKIQIGPSGKAWVMWFIDQLTISKKVEI